MSDNGSFAQDLLNQLRSRGFALRVAEGKLLVKPADRLTAEDREAIKANRDTLVRLLEAPPPVDPPEEVSWCIDTPQGPWVVGTRALARRFEAFNEWNRACEEAEKKKQ